MKRELALKVIFVIAIAGILFSGYLSYQELFVEQPTEVINPLLGCTKVEAGNILSLPACVYGLVMYIVVAVVSGLGAFRGK